MRKIKIVIALVAVAALALVIVGLASAQIVANQTGTAPNQSTVPNSGLWGWIGNCFGFRGSQPYANQYIAPPVPTNSSVAAPYQGGYGYGYGYGPCGERW